MEHPRRRDLGDPSRHQVCEPLWDSTVELEAAEEQKERRRSRRSGGGEEGAASLFPGWGTRKIATVALHRKMSSES